MYIFIINFKAVMENSYADKPRITPKHDDMHLTKY